jgi:hypothetical protein
MQDYYTEYYFFIDFFSKKIKYIPLAIPIQEFILKSKGLIDIKPHELK